MAKTEKKEKNNTPQKQEIEIDMQTLLMPLAIVIASIIISVPISLSIYFGLRDAGIGGGVAGVAQAAECDADDPFSEDCLLTYAEELELNMNEFEQCVTNETYDDAVSDDLAYGQEIGVGGTPTLIIGENIDGERMRGFFISAGATRAQVQTIAETIRNDGIEDAADAWVESQLDTLDSYETQLRDFYVEQGQSGETLENSIEAGLAQREAEIESEGEIDEFTYGDNVNAKGDEDASVALMEFSDYECPFCQQFAAGDLGNYVFDEAEDGNMLFVFRDFPLESIHPNARAAANAARCAGDQGQYFEYHDKLFGIE
jgi:protein-disulfide isomerase